MTARDATQQSLKYIAAIADRSHETRRDMPSAQPPTPQPDFLSLASASMEELVEHLELAVAAGPSEPGLPAATHQLAALVRAESIRLIRLGTPRETSDASLALIRFARGGGGRALADVDAEADRIVTATTAVLGAAVAPHSSGGELAVLRSWNGLARRIVARVDDADDRALPRAELLGLPGVTDQSHLSHVLRDLEAAGLIVKIRSGRSVTVHLGPVGRAPHVRELLRTGTQIDSELATHIGATLERIVAPARVGADSDGVQEDVGALARRQGLEAVLDEVRRFRARVQSSRVTLDHTTVSSEEIVAFVRLRGMRWGDGPETAERIDLRQAWLVHARDERVVSVERWAPSVEEQLGASDPAAFDVAALLAPSPRPRDSRPVRVGRWARAHARADAPGESNSDSVVSLWTREQARSEGTADLTESEVAEPDILVA